MLIFEYSKTIFAPCIFTGAKPFARALKRSFVHSSLLLLAYEGSPNWHFRLATGLAFTTDSKHEGHTNRNSTHRCFVTRLLYNNNFVNIIVDSKYQ
jgi:hypothetical protein